MFETWKQSTCKNYDRNASDDIKMNGQPLIGVFPFSFIYIYLFVVKKKMNVHKKNKLAWKLPFHKT